MGLRGWIVVVALLMAVELPLGSSAQTGQPAKSRRELRQLRRAERRNAKNLPPVERPDFRVEGGVIRQIIPAATPADSLAKADSLAIAALAMPQDTVPADSLTKAELLSKREQRRIDLARRDSIEGRYNRYFRDTMPLSRMTAISMLVPGFSQFHNEQYWKIPLAYASLAGMIWGYSHFNAPYKQFRSQYDYVISNEGAQRTPYLDRIQTGMIQYNTRRQLFMAGIYTAWVYFVCDGAVNYPGTTSSVKKATTLSTILPGAGQVFNRSYWKVPFVLGGFATMAYVIDWNNRGFNRFKLAYNLVNDGDPNTVDEFNGRYSGEFLRNLRNNYRRNRDLCIILTGGFYLLNIIDAHVDSQLKDYDISDDLSMNLEPTMLNFYSMRTSHINLPGLCFSVRF